MICSVKSEGGEKRCARDKGREGMACDKGHEPDSDSL